MGLNPAHVMKIIVQIFGKQIFRTGFVHSDPHPANVMVRKAKSGGPEVVVSNLSSFFFLKKKVSHLVDFLKKKKKKLKTSRSLIMVCTFMFLRIHANILRKCGNQ